jgi:histidine triad (HIT) family protein
MRLKKFSRKCLAWVARYRLFQGIILWSIVHMSNMLPIERLRETDSLIAFHHPEPNYPVHILILLKRSVPTLMDLATTDASLLMEIIQTAQSLVQEFNLQGVGYRLIVNGGKYQSLPQLHFHLVSDSSIEPSTAPGKL